MNSISGAFVDNQVEIYRAHMVASLHGQLCTRATLARAFAAITGRTTVLPSLAHSLGRARIVNRQDEGLQTIPLSRVIGSEGRREDFDRCLRPLKAHTRERWCTLALAVQAGVELPPVHLIRIGDGYYIRDGHHRLSVARALGQTEIEALVTAYQVLPAAAIEPQEPSVARAAAQEAQATAA